MRNECFTFSAHRRQNHGKDGNDALMVIGKVTLKQRESIHQGRFIMKNQGQAGFGLLVLALVAVMSGCQSGMSRTDAPASPASPPASAAAAPSAAPKIGPGMASNGEVTNSKLVEEGYGRKIKGLGDWEGEITGKAAANSSFNKLQIGMSLRQVMDVIGQPTDQGAYITGKAFIPFYFGSDKHRYEFVYKGQGRLIFAGGGMSDYSSGHLIWIIHSPTEGGYR